MGLKDLFKRTGTVERTEPVVAMARPPRPAYLAAKDAATQALGEASAKPGEPATPDAVPDAAPDPAAAAGTEVSASTPLSLVALLDDAHLTEARARKAEAEREEAARKLEALSLSLLDRWTELESEAAPAAAPLAANLAAQPGSEATQVPSSMAADVSAVVGTIPDAILTFDAEGCIVAANAGAESMFGYRAAALRGRPLAELLPEDADGAAADWLALAQHAGGGRSVHEWRGLKHDGTPMVVEVSVGAVTVGGTQHGAVVVRDITARRAAADALRAQVAETQAALDALRAAQERLVQSEKMASLGTLVAGIAHEINTPVGIAVTAASHLRDRMKLLGEAIRDGTLKKSLLVDTIATSQQSAEMVMANLERAAELIQSFKQVAVDQTSREARTVDLDVYLHETIHSLQPRIKATTHRVELLCAPGIRLHLAAGALSQVVSNAVLNALDHAFTDGRSGTVRVTAEREGETVRLAIRDDGVGIPADVLPRIYDPFFTTRRGAGGSGLGLHIVYNLVTQTLGGQIAVQSTPGEGTTFTITLPAAAAFTPGGAAAA